jgi:hypothetical protein
MPNVSPKGSLAVWDDNHLALRISRRRADLVALLVQHFGKITGDFSLGMLIAFGRFASDINNVVELLFARDLEGRPLERTHCSCPSLPRSSQCVLTLI